MKLTILQAEEFSKMPLEFLKQEYPNHIMHLMNNDKDTLTPKQLHPTFYGCYDWHSAVHGFWLLIRCLNLFPNLSTKKEIIKLFDAHFTAEAIQQEIEYFIEPNRISFERPYGFAWLLYLDQELLRSKLEQAKKWRAIIQPLSSELKERFLSYLKILSYPIRFGTHYNTAFALALALDYSKTIKDKNFEEIIKNSAIKFYQFDTNYPANYEPGGTEFISNSLMQGLLMSKVLNRDKFQIWFEEFLPNFTKIESLMNPACVSDRTDPQIAHLDGLNLSKAWCLKKILKTIDLDEKDSKIVEKSIKKHINASINHIIGSNYVGGHWLATYALLALEE